MLDEPEMPTGFAVCDTCGKPLKTGDRIVHTTAPDGRSGFYRTIYWHAPCFERSVKPLDLQLKPHIGGRSDVDRRDMAHTGR